MKTITLQDRAETARWGEALGARLRPGDVVALVGDLGAGKTTLTQALARGLGIRVPVTSPTFTLIQEYPGPTPLFHFDPYRLDDPEDVADLGFDEYFERDGVVVIEWADKVSAFLPPERLTLRLDIPTSEMDMTDGEDAPRLLTLEAIGSHYVGLVAEMEELFPGSPMEKDAPE